MEYASIFTRDIVNHEFRSAMSGRREVPPSRLVVGAHASSLFSAGVFFLAISIAPMLAQQAETRGVGTQAGGIDICKPGFVWREAVKLDHVCVARIAVGRDRWYQYNDWIDGDVAPQPGAKIGPDVAYDVTTIVQKWANGNPNFGFVAAGRRREPGRLYVEILPDNSPRQRTAAG